MSISILVTNPDGMTVSPVMVELPAYDEYLDKPRKFEAQIEKNSGLDPKGTGKVTRRGKIIILGPIGLDRSKAKYDSLTIESAESLLDDRIGQFYRFPAGTTLGSMLQMLIDMANGLIPRGAWSLHSGSVYKVVGAGTSSRFGTLTALYQGATALTKKTSIPTAAGQWYQSATDLYVWARDSRSPAYSVIIAPLWKDTLLRLGTISLSSTTFTVCYEIGETKIFPTVKALILAAGLEYAVRYEKDGYAYLDASATVGQGSEAAPVATYRAGNAEITVDEVDGMGSIQALIGQGAGAGMTQQAAASWDLSALGTWREGLYRAGGLFGAMLATATAKVFSDYSDPSIYKIVADEDWAQSCGNYVGIVGPGQVTKRIKHLSLKGGKMTIEAGQRLRTLQELLKAEEEVEQVLSSFYGSHTKNAWSWSLPDTNIDSYESITHSFMLASTDDSTKDSDDDTLGSGEIDPNFPYQVLLSLNIDWYTSDTYSATVNTDSHSSVGSHSGYGGTSTSAKTQSAHGVLQATGLASAGSYILCIYDGGSVTSGYGGDHAHGVSAQGYYTGSSGSPAHSHVYYYPSVNSGGGHYHAVDPGGGVAVPPWSHTHPMPGHYTQDAEAQSHETATESAKTRAGSSAHPEREAILEGLKKKYGTGNSVHYLTIAVKVNGSAVPGSPFSGDDGAGLYIGDSLDNIDISDLVVVGQKNTIEITLAEFGGAGPVRCSVSGTVNVNAVISAF